MGFFSKKNQDIVGQEADVPVESMPAEFYNGANPVVKYKIVEKEFAVNKSGNALTASEKLAHDQSAAVGGNSPSHLINLLTSTKFLLLSTAVLFVIFGAGAGVYYWLTSRPVVVDNPLPLPVKEEMANETAATSTIADAESIATSTEEAVAVKEVKKFLEDMPPEYPSVVLGKSTDSDNDDISDAAEELFTTDPSVPDSDKDKYNDGHEVYNLYNPTGVEPMKLIESGLIKDFANPVFNYKVYIPNDWAIGNVDENYRDVLFSALTGESMEIRAIEKTAGQTFADWFNVWAPKEKFSDLKQFTTVFKDKGWSRADNLVYYFETPRRVYVVLYHTINDSAINYGIVIKMAARSFRLPTSSEEIPLPIIEGAPGATTTSVENSNAPL